MPGKDLRCPYIKHKYSNDDFRMIFFEENICDETYKSFLSNKEYRNSVLSSV